MDVVAFANLAQLYFLDKEVECQLRDYLVDNFENLVEHTNRIKERCFPDWDDMCKNLDLNSHLPKPPPAEDKPKEDGEKKLTENKTEKEATKEPEEKVRANYSLTYFLYTIKICVFYIMTSILIVDGNWL